MEVKVIDGLPCRLTVMDPHVVAVRGVLGLDRLLHPRQCGDDLALLLRGRVEPAGHAAPGNDEGVAIRHGESVPEGINTLALEEDPVGIRGAEGAGRMGHDSAGAGGRRVMVSLPEKPGRPQDLSQRRAFSRRGAGMVISLQTYRRAVARGK